MKFMQVQRYLNAMLCNYTNSCIKTKEYKSQIFKFREKKNIDQN